MGHSSDKYDLVMCLSFSIFNNEAMLKSHILEKLAQAVRNNDHIYNSSDFVKISYQ